MSSVDSSTARRKNPPRTRVLGLVLIVLAGSIIVLELLRPSPGLQLQPEIHPPLPTPSPSPPGPTVTPTPTATPEPTAAAAVVPTPTFTPTLIPIAPRRRQYPSPTPGITKCLPYKWSMTGATPSLNQIFIQIEATNRCGRKLTPEEIWFEISGVRAGSVEHRVRAHPFEEVWPGRTVRVSVGLQGSVDWYDEVRVVLLGP